MLQFPQIALTTKDNQFRLSLPTASLRQQNADVIAFNVVGDEVRFPILVYVDHLDTPRASPCPERRARRALKATVTVAEKHSHAMFRAKGEIDLPIVVQIYRHHAPTTVAQLERRILRLR